LEPKRTQSDLAPEQVFGFIRVAQRPKVASEDGIGDREVVSALNIDVAVAQR
jgi:hypothetical protein